MTITAAAAAPRRSGAPTEGDKCRVPRPWWSAALLTLLAGVLACTAAPRRFTHLATDLGLRTTIAHGTKFAHVVAFNRAGRTKAPELHVYLEGDGMPWVDERWVARDPTPRNLVMLRLMALDPSPSVYLGRPCYYGLADAPPCHPRHWTHGRYAPAIVDSMETALRGIVAERGASGIALFGHSGGGTLALLLAERMPATRVVVTLAGNLDVRAWSRHHGFSPLAGSLDPARQPPLDPAIRQVHLAGGLDTVIPPALTAPAAARQSNTSFEVHEDFDHACCWDRVWPEILKRIAVAPPAGPR